MKLPQRARLVRIVHITPSFAPAWRYGGPIYTVLQLCGQLARGGCDVRVLTTDADGPRAVLDVPKAREVDMAQRLRVRYCRRQMPDAVSAGLLRYLPSYVRWADVVHLTGVYSFTTIPTLLACRVLRKPLVWSPRGALQRWAGTTRPRARAIWEAVCRAVAAKRVLLHVTSKEEAAESCDHLGGVPAVIIPNGVEIPDNVVHTRPGAVRRLLFLGRLHPKKGIENLLAACRLLSDRGHQYTLTIAGAGDGAYDASIGRKIEELGLRQAKMIGEVIGDAKRRAFEEADVVVVPSHTENFCVVVAEALAHGIPVIASKGTPWAEVEQVGCGLWVDNDPANLAEAVERASRMPLEEMGHRGRRWMIEQFAWDKISARMLECYSSLACIQ